MTPKALRTAHLDLEPLSRRDRAFVLGLLQDRDVRRYLGGPVMGAAAAVVMDRYLAPAGETAVWRVARDGDPVGLVFLGPHAETAGAEVSYQFAPKVWGAGVAFEAVSEVLRWAQDPCGAPCAVAETQAANLRSLGLLRRLGFTEARRFHRFGAEQVLVIRPLGPRGT